MNAQASVLRVCAVCDDEAVRTEGGHLLCNRCAPPEKSAAEPHVSKGRKELHHPSVLAVANPEPVPSPNPVDIPPPERPDIEVYLGLFKLGEIEPEPVLLPSLPKGATRTMQRIVDFYVLDHGLRLAV